VNKAEVHLSIGPLLGFLERFFPMSRSFTIAVRLEQLRELSKGATQFREHLLSDVLRDGGRCRQNGTAGRGSPRWVHRQLLACGELTRARVSSVGPPGDERVPRPVAETDRQPACCDR
jgi:hypothetical protein